MKDGLYNRAAYGLPAGAAEVFAHPVANLAYGPHSLAESREDRYGVADLPGSIEILAEDVVEVQVLNGRPIKAVVRFPYDDALDLVLVLVNVSLANTVNLFVKTCWFNQASDKHKTLRLAPYSKP